MSDKEKIHKFHVPNVPSSLIPDHNSTVYTFIAAPSEETAKQWIEKIGGIYEGMQLVDIDWGESKSR